MTALGERIFRDRHPPEASDLSGGVPGQANLFVPLGHFYSPMPSLDEISKDEKRIFAVPQELAAIDLNVDEQLSFRDEETPGLRYKFLNSMYSYSDAICLYGMIRHLKPQTILEVGAGYSSCVMLDTNELFFGNRISCTFIEPNLQQFLSLLKKKDLERIEIVPSRLQDVSLSRFAALAANDILFIDSTHVSKIGSDVNYLIFEILPVLQSGVYVHFHDIFYPFEYPKQWIFDLGIVWSEAYLLRSFLQYNSTFRIAFFNTYLERFYEEIFRDSMPLCLKNRGGSLWLRKV
jgi:predicted O-methyltransferase YrrM